MSDLGFEPKEVLTNLRAQQIDPLIEINTPYGNILSQAASLFHARGIDDALSYELSMLPGMTQLFSLLKIEEVFRSERYDLVVLDMDASGDALRYLYLPKLVGSIGKKLAGLLGIFGGFGRMFQTLSKLTTAPDVRGNESDFLARLEALSIIMRNQQTTSVRLVANPDNFSIENAKRAFMSANLFGINVDLAIINKIMPAGSSDQYYGKWANVQRAIVEEAKANFYPLPVKEVKLHGTELRGIEMLRANGQLIFQDEDPAKVFYGGEAFRFAIEDSLLRITIKVPFTEKDDLDVERHGDQLAIKVKNRAGYVVNTVPLPAATVVMKLSQAKLQGNELTVLFEKNRVSHDDTPSVMRGIFI
jgi:arsenite-transporting ATPase